MTSDQCETYVFYLLEIYYEYIYVLYVFIEYIIMLRLCPNTLDLSVLLSLFYMILNQIIVF